VSRFLPIPDALHAYAYGCDITEALIVAILWLYSRPASREFIGAALEARNSPTSKRSIQRLLSRLSDLGLVSTIGANKSIQYYATEEAIALFPNHPDGLPKSALTLRAKNAPQASLSDSLRAKNAPQMSICAPKNAPQIFRRIPRIRYLRPPLRERR
jgi:predicted transcriptional regulator